MLPAVQAHSGLHGKVICRNRFEEVSEGRGGWGLGLGKGEGRDDICDKRSGKSRNKIH